MTFILIVTTLTLPAYPSDHFSIVLVNSAANKLSLGCHPLDSVTLGGPRPQSL